MVNHSEFQTLVRAFHSLEACELSKRVTQISRHKGAPSANGWPRVRAYAKRHAQHRSCVIRTSRFKDRSVLRSGKAHLTPSACCSHERQDDIFISILVVHCAGMGLIQPMVTLHWCSWLHSLGIGCVLRDHMWECRL